MSGLPPGNAATTLTAARSPWASGLLNSAVNAGTCEVSQPMMPALKVFMSDAGADLSAKLDANASIESRKTAHARKDPVDDDCNVLMGITNGNSLLAGGRRLIARGRHHKRNRSFSKE